MSEDIKIPKEEFSNSTYKFRFLQDSTGTIIYGKKFINIQIEVKEENHILNLENLKKELCDLGKWNKYKELKTELNQH